MGWRAIAARALSVLAAREALHLMSNGMEEEASSLYRNLTELLSDSEALPDILVAYGTTLLTCGRCQEARNVCERWGGWGGWGKGVGVRSWGTRGVRSFMWRLVN